jgi:valine dehydrogenase (NAD+)
VGVFDRETGHEQVVYCADAPTGLRAIIAIYSTARGPALGGTRFYPYRTEDDALADVLELSRAMAYKAACANLDLGGGKAVIIGDPHTDKSAQLLRAYGRYVDSLSGRYYTACDVGTYVEDMDVLDEVCRYVTGRSPERGGAGDSSVLTAYGVFVGMRAAAEFHWGGRSLAGRRVAIAGVGKVGHRLAAHLVEEGARVIVADVDADAVAALRSIHPEVEAVEPEALLDVAADVYAPCALGHALSDETVPRLQVEVVCGGANNQLAHPGIEAALAERGVLYAPDYVVNAGGLIAVADEIHGYDHARAAAKTAEIFDTTLTILRLGADEGIPPAVAADRLAERRMAAARHEKMPAPPP